MSGASTPRAFRYPPPSDGPHARIDRAARRLLGISLFPSEGVARSFAEGLTRGDPVAEAFVDDTVHGAVGPARARALLEQALRGSIDDVPDAPESMRRVFADFERLPIGSTGTSWRRERPCGAGGGTPSAPSATPARWTPTRRPLALPLSLSGGYAGRAALNRYLETARWWIEVSRPGALFTRGSRARTSSMHVRVMHVSVRARVARHDEWDAARLGLPISQSAMLLTLLGGSVAPALGLFALGYVTSRHEMRAVLHFNRLCGHLVGCRCDDFFPTTVLDAWRILFMCDAARSYDAAPPSPLAAELVESFVPAFAPVAGHTGRDRLRAALHLRLQAAYSGLYMLPWNRRRYTMPSPLPGIALLLARAPAITALELARRVSPAADRAWQRASLLAWERWLTWQSEGRAARFDAARPLRR